MEPVNFDFEGSLQLARQLWSYADQLEDLARARADAGEVALTGWLGAFADQFVHRLDAEVTDLRRLAGRLRTEADQWAQAWTNAVDELQRRRWTQRVEEIRGGAQLLGPTNDFLAGYDYPPDPTPAVKPIPPAFHATVR